MNTGSVMNGRALISLMVCTVPGAPAMLNLMVSRPASPAGASPEAALVLAAVSASRRVTKPSSRVLSSTLVTVRIAGTARSWSASRDRRARRAGDEAGRGFRRQKAAKDTAWLLGNGAGQQLSRAECRDRRGAKQEIQEPNALPSRSEQLGGVLMADGGEGRREA